MTPPTDPLSTRVDGARIHSLERGPPDGPAVLLLHGQAFRASTWDELGTLNRLAEAGYRAIAIDLPGYGDSEETALEPGAFLAALLETFGLVKPILVSPSMSGRFSLPLSTERPELLGGYVPIGVAGVAAFEDRLAHADVPTLVFWGGADTVFPVASAHALAERMPRAEVAILQGAGHACYLDQPDEFHERLLAFCESLRDER